MSIEILAVDDSPTQAMKLQFILEDNGYSVRIARDGQSAIAKARELTPSVIISDIVMPDMDGYALCRYFKSDAELRDVPVILLTTLSSPRDILQGLEAKADAYLTKPYDEKVLISRIQALLRHKDEIDRSAPMTRTFVERDTVGLEVYLEGEHHVVTAGRRQMLNLLLSTYENAVRQNLALTETQRKLESLNAQLQEQNERVVRSESNYLSLLNDKTDAVFVVDRGGSVRFVNPAGEELLSKSASELQNAPFPYDFAPSANREIEIAPAVPGHDEDGLIAEMHAVASVWEGEDVWLVTLRDITARKRSERRIEEQQEALREANARLEALATLDGLTGIYNHRAAKERLAAEWGRAHRYGPPLSVLMLDVDKFKQYNDSFGHPAGDEVLKRVAALLREKARESDTVARYGGEEFIVILPNTGNDAAIVFAERLRVALEAEPWPLRAVTASFGASTLNKDFESSDDLIAAADRALYHSKESGRNRVSHAQDI